MTERVEVHRDIAATAEAVYDLIADVTRMGQWSPETTGCVWVRGADGPAVGAKFRGRNRNGRRHWSMTCVVTDAEPGRRFAFVVLAGPLRISRWEYTIEPTPTGCRVTEVWSYGRGRTIRLTGRLTSGVADRPEHNRKGMEETLRRLGSFAERSPTFEAQIP